MENKKAFCTPQNVVSLHNETGWGEKPITAMVDVVGEARENKNFRCEISFFYLGEGRRFHHFAAFFNFQKQSVLLCRKRHTVMQTVTNSLQEVIT